MQDAVATGANTAPGASPRSRMTEVTDRLTTSERRIVLTLLSNYPEAGLRPVAGFAALAKVSGPTIIRFVRKLGYPSYAAFQDALRHELAEFTYSPAQLLDAAHEAYLDPGTGRAREATPRPALDFSLLDRELGHAAQILGDPRATVYTLGGIWSHPVALHLSNSLQRLRASVFALTADTLPPAIVNADRRTVFIVCDFRKYAPEFFAGMQLAVEKRATVILITDRWVSPIAALSRVLLPVDIDHPPFDSLIAPIALAETLAERVRCELGHAQDARITELYRVYEAVGAVPRDAGGGSDATGPLGTAGA